MRKITITIGFVFLLLLAKAQLKEYCIKGKVKGISVGMIKMFAAPDNIQVIDSAVIKDEKFVMKGITGLSEKRRFLVLPVNWNFSAFVEAGVSTMIVDTADAINFGNTRSMPIWPVKQTGSPMANIYKNYADETGLSNIFLLIKKIRNVHIPVMEKTLLNMEMDTLIKNLSVSQERWIQKFISQNPASIAGLYLLKEYYDLSSKSAELYNYLKKNIAAFLPEIKNSIYYKELASSINSFENTQAGNPAPDFSLLTRSKRAFTLSSLRGTYVLLDFWASWCIPCRQAIPNWKEIYKKYQAKGFTIVSIADDRDWNDWTKALDKEKMPWTQVIDDFPDDNHPARVSSLYTQAAIPCYVLIDKNGSIIFNTNDQALMTKKIEELLQ